MTHMGSFAVKSINQSINQSKILMKLKMIILIALRFIPMGQKTMTGSDAAQLFIIHLLNKGYQVTLPFLPLKLQQLT